MGSARPVVPWARSEVPEAIQERYRQGKSLAHTDGRNHAVRQWEAARIGRTRTVPGPPQGHAGKGRKDT